MCLSVIYDQSVNQFWWWFLKSKKVNWFRPKPKVFFHQQFAKTTCVAKKNGFLPFSHKTWKWDQKARESFQKGCCEHSFSCMSLTFVLHLSLSIYLSFAPSVSVFSLFRFSSLSLFCSFRLTHSVFNVYRFPRFITTSLSASLFLAKLSLYFFACFYLLSLRMSLYLHLSFFLFLYFAPNLSFSPPSLSLSLSLSLSESFFLSPYSQSRTKRHQRANLAACYKILYRRKLQQWGFFETRKRSLW